MDDLEEVALVGSGISAPTNHILTLHLHRPIYDSLDAHPVKIEGLLLKVPTSPYKGNGHTIRLISLVTLHGNRKDDLDFRKYIFLDWGRNNDLENLQNTFRKGKKKKLNIVGMKTKGTLPNLTKPKYSDYYVMYRRKGDGKDPDPEYERVNIQLEDIQLEGEEHCLNTAYAIALYTNPKVNELERKQKAKRKKRKRGESAEFDRLVVGKPCDSTDVAYDWNMPDQTIKCKTLITKHLLATSDERAKNKLGPIPDGILAVLKLLKLYVYEWKDDGSLDAGPMAQELFSLFGKTIPGIVKYKKDRTVPTSLEEIASAVL